MMTLSASGLALIKSFEGFRARAYQDSAGVWTVGYGHTGPGVKAGLVIAEPLASQWLTCDVARAVRAVNVLVTVPLQQHQFDALVDFAFNCGVGALQRSELLRLLNAHDYPSAGAQFMAWTHVDGAVIPGLERRRAAEQTLFLSTPTAEDHPV